MVRVVRCWCVAANDQVLTELDHCDVSGGGCCVKTVCERCEPSETITQQTKKKCKHKRAVLLVGFDVVVSNSNWTKRFFVHFSFPFPLEVNALLFTRTNIHKHQVTVLGCRAKKDHLIRTEEERGLNEKVKKEQWVGKTTNKEIWKKLHIDQ